jgi:hypothetical protein
MPLGRATQHGPLHDGVELCCDRDGLLLGLALAIRALTRSAGWSRLWWWHPCHDPLHLASWRRCWHSCDDARA